MLQFVYEHYVYWLAVAVIMLGLYIIMASDNLIKKVMGLNVFQTAVFVLYIAIGNVDGGTAPIAGSYTVFSNPLPHVLILTAIVVGVATSALAFALVVRIHGAYGTLEEDEIARLEEAE